MTGRINNEKITAMIDFGSLVTIITTKDLKDILCTDVIFARSLPLSEKYVDFNQKPLKIAGFIHVQLKVAKQEVERASILATATGRPLVGRDWQDALQCQFKPSQRFSVFQ